MTDKDTGSRTDDAPAARGEIEALFFDGGERAVDQHGWHHMEPAVHVAPPDIGGIHIHDSIAVIEKASRSRPEARRVGG